MIVIGHRGPAATAPEPSDRVVIVLTVRNAAVGRRGPRQSTGTVR
jgi:hypothetical protein